MCADVFASVCSDQNRSKNDVNAQYTYIVHFLFLYFYCKLLITHISICALSVMHTQARTQPHTHIDTNRQTLCILAALQRKICAINICIQLALEFPTSSSPPSLSLNNSKRLLHARRACGRGWQ